MQMPEMTLTMNAPGFTNAVQALIEAFGMNAENQFRAIQGNSPAYREVDFAHLSVKYDLDLPHIDEVLSDSEKQFFEERCSQNANS